MVLNGWLKLAMEKERIIVSLTTYDKRIGNIPFVLNTILAQTLSPDIIVLNLAYDEIIPDDVREYLDTHSIEVNRVPDTKVYKKLIHTLKKYPRDCVISIDDDFLYPEGMIEDFVHIHSLYPNNPISGNSVVQYGLQCHCGCASLMKYSYLGKYIDSIDDEVIKHCPSDDLVYTYFSNKNNHPYLRTKELYSNNMQSFNEGDSYSKAIGGGKGILDTYNYLVNRFGRLEHNLILSYVPNMEPYLASVIDDVFKQKYGTEMFSKGYDKGVAEMKSSSPFRIGRIMLFPLIFIRSLYKNYICDNEQ